MSKILVVGYGITGKALCCVLKNENGEIDVDDNNTCKRDEFMKDGFGVFDFGKKYDYCFICVPTPLDEKSGKLDCSMVKDCMEKYKSHAEQVIVHSTISIEFSEELKEEWYMPEFLTEKNYLSDVFNPDRIVIGTNSPSKECSIFFEMYSKCIGKNKKLYIMSTRQAAAVKLYSNAYLAMRISFFDEIASFLGSDDCLCPIKAICEDKRIGDFYNIPMKGFGGHCLPKDTADICTETKSVLLSGVIESNKKYMEKAK